jgi:hypothetical protein
VPHGAIGRERPGPGVQPGVAAGQRRRQGRGCPGRDLQRRAGAGRPRAAGDREARAAGRDPGGATGPGTGHDRGSRPRAAVPGPPGEGPAGPAAAGSGAAGAGGGPGRAGGDSGCAAPGRAGLAGRRAVAGPLGACGGPVARAFGTGGARGTRLGQAGRGGAATLGRWCRLEQRRGRGNLAGSGPGRTGWQGPSRGAGQATRAGWLCRGRGCAARDSRHERPGRQWSGHRRCGPVVQGFGERQGCGHRLADGRLRHGRERPAR